MTADEIKNFMINGGYVDCDNSDDLKISVLNVLEDLGFCIGFEKADAVFYRYIFYSHALSQVHMKDSYSGSNVVPASAILCSSDEQISVDADNLDDWIEFFCCS